MFQTRPFLLLLCLLMMQGFEGIGRAQTASGGPARKFNPVGLEVVWKRNGTPLLLGTAPENGLGLRVTRADFLISGLALRRADGSWLESREWYACFLAAGGRNRALLEGVPAQVYTAVRFQIGVDRAADEGDPNRWPAGHALNPLVNGLHWGWQGGYIHMALEGHWRKKDGTDGGFSYHLAGDSQRRTIMLEGALDLTAGGTVALGFDVGRALAGIDPAAFGESTHSREGDSRADRLREQAAGAFTLDGVLPEIWQDNPVSVAGGPAEAGRPAGTPWPLRISSRFPKPDPVPGNSPTLEGVALGKRLFHETALSLTNKQSCASCHARSAGFTDPAGGRFSLGVEGQEGTRNAMPLFNLAWQKEFFWDGRADRLREQVLEPIRDPVEMHLPLDQAAGRLSVNGEYRAAFDQVFGPGGVTPERMGLALEQFLLTLVSQDSRFDRALLGRETLTARERRGLELFVTEHDPARNLRGADCFHCHGGALFSNQGFANNGLDLVPAAGRRAVTGQEADHGKFRVPSLRNIAVTGPYMHDGRFRTLEEVIDHYDHGVHRSATLDPNLAKHPDTGLGLSAEDKAALAAFLRTLTDEAFLSQDQPSRQTAQNP